jgi:hypothetical protein
MKTHIAAIAISTKKGHSQTTRWVVTQSRPYPDLHGHSGLDWRNTGGLIPQYGQSTKTPTIGTEYRCHLLHSDFDPATATGNRNDFAGFSPGLVYGTDGNRSMQPELPGTIELRGKSLGEMCVTFGNNPEWPDITVRGFGSSPTPSEREWIKSEICPALRLYIAANVDSLKVEAVEELKTDVAKRLASYRADIDKAEAKMMGIIAKL